MRIADDAASSDLDIKRVVGVPANPKIRRHRRMKDVVEGFFAARKQIVSCRFRVDRRRAGGMRHVVSEHNRAAVEPLREFFADVGGTRVVQVQHVFRRETFAVCRVDRGGSILLDSPSPILPRARREREHRCCYSSNQDLSKADCTTTPRHFGRTDLRLAVVVILLR